MQNSTPVDLRLSTLQLTNIPLYYVVLGTVLLTLIFSWIVSVINSVSSTFALHGKDNTVKKLKKENADLEKKIHQLEVDNARILGERESS